MTGNEDNLKTRFNYDEFFSNHSTDDIPVKEGVYYSLPGSRMIRSPISGTTRQLKDLLKRIEPNRWEVEFD